MTRTELPGGNCDTTTPTGCINYTYDDSGQIIASRSSDPATPDITYAYGDRGELASFSDGTGTTTDTYDSLGRRTGATDGNGDTTGYQWNLAWLLTATTYPNGDRVTNTYDNAGRLTQVTDWTNRKYTYAYDQNSNVTSLTCPQNVDSFNYDNADRPTTATYTQGTTTLASISFDIGETGRLDAATTTGLPSGPETFTYDDLDQLVDADGDTYDYDLSHNPTLIDGDTRQVFDNANLVSPPRFPDSG